MADLHFDEASHTYTLNGQVVPSVTQILDAVVPKPFERAMWYGYRLGKQGLHPEDKRTAAAQLGTQVHLALADLANGDKIDPFDYPDEAAGFIKGLEKFISVNGPVFLSSEKQTHSERHNYAGTLDAHVKFTRGDHKGRTARLDLKTGRVYPDSHFPQLVAYELAETEQGYPPSDFQAVLKVTPTGRHRLIQSTDTVEDWLILKAHYDSVKRRSDRTQASRSK